jgi:hypothetical protein
MTSFSKYLLCESKFSASVKRDVIDTVKEHLKSMKKSSMTLIRNKLENTHKVDKAEEIGDIIEKEISRINESYITTFTEYVNSRRW